MKKGLDILAKGNVIPGTDQLHVAGHPTSRWKICSSEFFAKPPSMTPEDAQKRFAEIIASAD